MTADRLFGIAGVATPLEDILQGRCCITPFLLRGRGLFAVVYGAMCLPSVK